MSRYAIVKFLGSLIKDVAPDYIDLDIDNRPITLDLSTKKANTNTLIGFSILWSAFFSLGIISMILESRNNSTQPILILTILVLAGLLVLKIVYDQSKTSTLIILKTKSLEFKTVHPRKDIPATEIKYEDFRGLVMSEKTFKIDQQYIPFQLIILVHENPKLNVVLHRVPSGTPPTEKWKALSKSLRVPILLNDGDDVSPIHWSQTEQPLRERETTSSVMFGSDGLTGENAPQGLKITKMTHDNEPILQVMILDSPRRLAIKAALVLSSIALMSYQGFSQQNISILTLAGMVLFVPATLFIIIDMLQDKILHISRAAIYLPNADLSRPKGDVVSSINNSEIESITIDNARFLNERIVIHGKTGRLIFGTSLSKPKLEWLQKYLRAAVVTS